MSLLLYTTASIANAMTPKDDGQNYMIQYLSGSQAKKYFKQIADIRINMFREYPYLYEGSYAYEEKYLETYFRSKNSVILLVFDGDEVVGFSNSIPLDEELDEIQAAFKDNTIPTKKYMYIGEVMIKKPYRHQGILRQFLEHHEQRAKNMGFSLLTFMTVKRPSGHLMEPYAYQAPDAIWHHFGYRLLENTEVKMRWKQIDTHQEENNVLSVWVKEIV